MSRGLDIERGDRRDVPRAEPSRPIDGHPRDPSLRSVTLPSRDFSLPSGPEREPVWARRGSYRLRDSESRILVVAATFRVVLERDLAGAYEGDVDRLRQDVKHLVGQGLLQRREIASDDAGHREAVLTLTPEGGAVLQAARAPDRPDGQPVQAIHAGWQKPAEVVHDASLYRMFQVEAGHIERQRGRVVRVVLGEDLKREWLRRANDPTAMPRTEADARTARAAAECQLPVVNGHVEIPDVRIEYETAEGRTGRVDLELVTEAYRAGQVAAKRAAGFTLYSAGGRSGMHALGGTGKHAGARSPDLMSELLSL
jgi:hypothetical protein